MSVSKGRAAAVALACGLVLFAPVAGAGAAPAKGSASAAAAAGPQDATGNQITSFFFAPSYLISPLPPLNQSNGQTVDASGVTFPRALISNVGTWKVTLTEAGMTVDSIQAMSIWASSDSGAQNVRFSVQVTLNGQAAGTLRTTTLGSLSATPVEFPMDPGSSQLSQMEFPQGSQLAFQLQYQASSSPLPVGPSGSSTFHYYGTLYRSRIDLVTNPFNLTLASAKMESDRVNVTEIVKDAFGTDPSAKLFYVSFSGPTSSVDRFVKKVAVGQDPINGTTIIWNWLFAQQGAGGSGSYSIALTAQYVGSDVNYSNVSTAEMKFPKPASSGKGFLPGFGALEGVAAVAAAALAAATARGRLRGRPKP